MRTERVSVLSDEPVEFSVAVDVDGLPYDPRSATVEAAAMATFDDPTSDDWHLGTWDVSTIGAYTANVIPGPSGMALARGTYYVWLRITDPFLGVALVRTPGTLVVQ
jgi:hypothetical protein